MVSSLWTAPLCGGSRYRASLPPVTVMKLSQDRGRRHQYTCPLPSPILHPRRNPLSPPPTTMPGENALSDPGVQNPEPVLIEVQGLTKRFGGFTAVDNVSFNVSRGEVVGFLGPNGAGKSTTMRMLAGFMIPTEGTARLLGHDVRTDGVAARRILGFLPEGAPTYGEMSVTSFLRFCAKIRGYRGAGVAERVGYAINLTRLESVRLQ